MIGVREKTIRDPIATVTKILGLTRPILSAVLPCVEDVCGASN
jgi:hypothetical protein